jgi:hypothetical protein
LEDRKVDGRMYVLLLLILLMMMVVEQVEKTLWLREGWNWFRIVSFGEIQHKWVCLLVSTTRVVHCCRIQQGCT